MPLTPNWTFWYPSGTDRPSQGTDDLYLLANTMDSRMTQWREDDDRLRKRPCAKLSYNSTVRYKINSTAQATVRYNTVEMDSASMTDLQRRDDRIYLPVDHRPGMYLVGGSVNGLVDNLATSVPEMRIVSNSRWSISGGVEYPYNTRDMNQDRHETTRGEFFQVSAIILAYQAVGGGFDDELWVSMEINSGIDFTVWAADMWAFWVSDVASIPQS